MINSIQHAPVEPAPVHIAAIAVDSLFATMPG